MGDLHPATETTFSDTGQHIVPERLGMALRFSWTWGDLKPLMLDASCRVQENLSCDLATTTLTGTYGLSVG